MSKALEDSIQHWMENLQLAKAGKVYNDHSSECALCDRYFDYNTDIEELEDEDEICTDCPLAKAGMRCGSGDDPWSIQSAYHYRDRGSPEHITAVENMLKTLVSLRSKE